eukprot:759743-Hanusia_phi.AAC.3
MAGKVEFGGRSGLNGDNTVRRDGVRMEWKKENKDKEGGEEGGKGPVEVGSEVGGERMEEIYKERVASRGQREWASTGREDALKRKKRRERRGGGREREGEGRRGKGVGSGRGKNKWNPGGKFGLWSAMFLVPMDKWRAGPSRGSEEEEEKQ